MFFGFFLSRALFRAARNHASRAQHPTVWMPKDYIPSASGPAYETGKGIARVFMIAGWVLVAVVIMAVAIH
jgi:hypothetical protein